MHRADAAALDPPVARPRPEGEEEDGDGGGGGAGVTRRTRRGRHGCGAAGDLREETVTRSAAADCGGGRRCPASPPGEEGALDHRIPRRRATIATGRGGGRGREEIVDLGLEEEGRRRILAP